MVATFNEVNNILKTLPVGYYAGRKIEVKLANNDASYYDIMNDEISISYNQVSDGLKNVPATMSLESSVRTMLYHEISHAILTPKMRVTFERNVFEDERIESLLADYYMNVDFKTFVKAVNNFNGQAPQTADEYFYQIVRYRVGPRKFTDRVHRIIMDYARITRLSDAWITMYYTDAIESLYADVVNDFQQKLQQQQRESESDQNPNEGSSKSSKDGSNFDLGEEQPSEEEIEHDEKLESKSTNMKQKIEQVFNFLIDSAMIADVQKILSNISKATRKNSSAINAYSGVFDPRSTIRDDYKFFVQANRVGHVKAFSKSHLNLFIDRSGSFVANQDTVNKLLYALSQFEKQNPDFTFDLVTCGDGETLLPKNRRALSCFGMNHLTTEVAKFFKDLQLPNCANYNIVLFDGDAFSACSNPRLEWKNFAAFNKSNVSIISDIANRNTIETYCPSAKKTFTNAYTKELYKNVMIALQGLTR